MSRQSLKQLVSAGGVVYRVNNGNVEVVICGRESPPVWGLPKGTPDPGETRRQAALREVTEETGLEVEADAFIGSINYRFFRTDLGVPCHKTVLFYLMTSIGGDTSLNDHEFDFVQWLPVDEALKTLTYDNEVRIVQKGLSMVSQGGRPK